MDILMSFHRKWTEQIFQGEKPLEFRSKIGKEFTIGKTVYMYETKKDNGSQRIVGEFEIADIQRLPLSKVGTYGLLPYFCKNILRDKEALEQVEKAYDINLPNYDNAIKLDYLYDLDLLTKLSKNEPFSFFDMSFDEVQIHENNRKKADNLIKLCDNWLFSIGFYNQYGETSYNYYLEIKDILKYEVPLNLVDFKNTKDEKLKTPPQSWCYVKRN